MRFTCCICNLTQSALVADPSLWGGSKEFGWAVELSGSEWAVLPPPRTVIFKRRVCMFMHFCLCRL